MDPNSEHIKRCLARFKGGAVYRCMKGRHDTVGEHLFMSETTPTVRPRLGTGTSECLTEIVFPGDRASYTFPLQEGEKPAAYRRGEKGEAFVDFPDGTCLHFLTAKSVDLQPPDGVC